MGLRLKRTPAISTTVNIGLVAEYSPATGETRVRIPVAALFLAGRWTTKLNQRSQRKTDLVEKTGLPHEPKEKSARKNATAGIRTRVSPVAGEYSATRPMLTLNEDDTTPHVI